MIRVSLDVMTLVLVTPALWAAFALLGVTLVLTERRLPDTWEAPSPGAGRWAVELSAMLILPLAMLAWGLHFWPSESAARSPHEAALVAALYGFAGAQVALAAWLIWRHRRRLWPTFAAVCLAVWWAAGALFTATMAVTNTWL